MIYPAHSQAPIAIGQRYLIREGIFRRVHTVVGQGKGNNSHYWELEEEDTGRRHVVPAGLLEMSDRA